MQLLTHFNHITNVFQTKDWVPVEQLVHQLFMNCRVSSLIVNFSWVAQVSFEQAIEPHVAPAFMSLLCKLFWRELCARLNVNVTKSPSDTLLSCPLALWRQLHLLIIHFYSSSMSNLQHLERFAVLSPFSSDTLTLLTTGYKPRLIALSANARAVCALGNMQRSNGHYSVL